MKRKKSKFNKRSSNPINKLSLFQKNDSKFSRKCPFSKKDSPKIDYKNIKLLKNLLGNGSDYKIKISYKIQKNPNDLKFVRP